MTVVVSALSAVLNSLLQLLGGPDVGRAAAEPARQGGDAEPGQVQARDSRRLLQHRERLEDGVLVVPHDHVHDRQLVLSGGPEGLHGVLGRAVADQADDRPADAPVPVSQRDPDRGREAPADAPAGRGEERSGPDRREPLDLLGHGGGRLVDDDRVGWPDPAQHGVDLRRGKRAARHLRQQARPGHRLRGGPRGALRDQVQEQLDRDPGVGQQGVAHPRGRGGLGAGGDLQQFRARRKEVAGNVGVVPEHLRADHDGQVVAGQPVADRLHRHPERPAEQGVVLREGGPVQQRRPVDGGAQLLRQGDGRVPPAAAVHLGPEDQRGTAAGGDAVGEQPQPLRVGGHPVAHRPDAGRAGQRLVPVVQRYRQEDRSGRRLQRHRVGPHERLGHVLRPVRLVGPLHPRLRHRGGLAVAQVRFPDHQLPVLLSRGDDQGRVSVVGRDQVPHGVSHARRGVQVDQGRAPGDLSEGVGHRDGGGLLQRQHVAEVAGEFLQEGLLGRTWVTEDGRQPEGSQQVVGHGPDGGFLGHRVSSSSRNTNDSYGWPVAWRRPISQVRLADR